MGEQWAKWDILWVYALIRRCTPSWSPLASAWDVLEYENVQFQGGLWTKTPYKGPPSLAVDAAWNALTDTYIVAIPPEALDQMNKSEAAVSFPPNSPKGAGGNALEQLRWFTNSTI